MDTNRRDFLQTTGAGAAGLGLAALVPEAAAQTAGCGRGATAHGR